MWDNTHAVKKEVCRCTPMTLRACIAHEIPGGYSRVLAMYLRVHLLGAHGSLTAGVPLDLGAHGGLVVLWAKLANLVADGEGFQLSYEWKGASSIRPCLRHYNVLSNGSGLAALDTSGQFVDLACSDPGKFRAWDHANLCANAAGVLEAKARREAGTMSKTMYDKVVKCAGFNTTSMGLLADTALAHHCDWVQVITKDWMHSFLQNGILTDEAFAMIKRAGHLGCTPDALLAFLRHGSWRYPSWVPGSAAASAEIFNPKRKPEDRLKCTASELLGMYGMLRCFIETEIAEDPSVMEERRSFMACCDVVDLILEAKRHGNAATLAPQVQQAMQRFLQLHVAAYGKELLKPKHHWGFDVCEQLARDNRVLDAFSLERLHLRSKKLANNAKNTSRFEATVLGGLIQFQLNSLQANSLDGGLEGMHRPLAELPNTMVANRMQWFGVSAARNDVVFDGSRMGVVVTCARHAQEQPYVIVDLYVHDARVSDHCSRWRAMGCSAGAARYATFPADRLRFPRAWKDEGDTMLVVV